MALYCYQARNSADAAVRGTIAAESPRHARDLLRAEGIRVQQMWEPRRRRRLRILPRRGSKLMLASAVRELATLLAVGIHLTDALDTLVQQHHGRFRIALAAVRDRVSSGAGLAQAMAEQPETFDPLAIAMVQVGEQAGTLDHTLGRLGDFLERSLQFKDRVTGALLYPCIVLAASLAVSVFLMTVVVPMLLSTLLETGRPLPWPTQILRWLSELLLHHGGWLVLAAAALAAALTAAFRTERGRRVGHRAVLKTPLLGRLVEKQAFARVAFVMATLLRSGVEFLPALEMAAGLLRNVVLRDALQAAGAKVRAGQDIGPALAAQGLLPPVVVHVFAIGQKSGQLDEMLERLATTYDHQVASMSDRFATLLEPVLILLLALVVGFILFATLLPILEAGNVL